MASEAPILRRLNGRPQACDQCRARKVACDHSQPTCTRCQKRRQACVYTVTPRPRPARTPRPATRLARRVNPPPTPLCSGYLGFTSHSAVFEETRNSLSLVRPSISVDASPRCELDPCPDRKELTPPLREMSRFVLRKFPSSEDFLDFKRVPCRPDYWAFLAAKRIVREFQDAFGTCLDDDLKLDAVVQSISSNTARPFREENVNTKEWSEQFSASSLRWESIGLVWTFWPAGTVQDVSAALGYCIDLALHYTPSNDLILFISFRKSAVDSIATGDASKFESERLNWVDKIGLECWKCHGETVAMMTFLGLHAEADNKEYRPTIISENRRRVFAQVFMIDKVMVSFTGRPPLINGRYCSTPLPLDLRDEDLLADEDTLARAVESLDEHGWNRDGVLSPATLLRARTMISYIREELLEIALGTRDHSTLDRLHDIKGRQIGTMSHFPAILEYRREDLNDPSADLEQLCSTLLLKLEHLQNLFFVERLMLRFGNRDDGNLLVVSFEMVSLTLTIWTHQDRFAGMRRDFEWLLMGYAAPGGGILCLELLRPTFHGTHPDCPKLTRSRIVQELSILVGFLGWVKPSAPNADLCADCKAVIQGVLDHSLNSPSDGQDLNSLDWERLQLDFNFNLLDTFDWMCPE